MLSSAAPMNVRPPAVVIGPPPRLEPPVLTPAGTPSIVPKGICQAISPVFTLIAVSLPKAAPSTAKPSPTGNHRLSHPLWKQDVRITGEILQEHWGRNPAAG